MENETKPVVKETYTREEVLLLLDSIIAHKLSIRVALLHLKRNSPGNNKEAAAELLSLLEEVLFDGHEE